MRAGVERGAMVVAPDAAGSRPAIGTLREGSLHAQLKAWYRGPGDELEAPVAGYVVDLVRGDLLVEIQTGGFAPLRAKLDALTREHRVRLVAPVALRRRIVRLSDAGVVLSARHSPRRGRVEDVFARLVSFPALLCRPRFELEVLLTHEDELRLHTPGRSFRRHGWTVAGRALTAVEARLPIRDPDDAAALLPGGLADGFDTSDLAEAAAISRRLAQQMVYCLRLMGALDTRGKRGRSPVYARAAASRPTRRRSR